MSFWGTVKETGVDDEGLVEFHREYYSFPLYKDVHTSLYQALGSRGIFSALPSVWNPFQLWRGLQSMNARLAGKNIAGNLKGEGLIQGGVLIFNNRGDLAVAFEEHIGSALEINDIRAAIRALLSASPPTNPVAQDKKNQEEL